MNLAFHPLRALKDLCEETLSGSISASNAVDLFQLGGLQGAKKLRAEALDYIAKEFEKVCSELLDSLVYN